MGLLSDGLFVTPGPVAQRITRLTTDQKIPGSNPGRIVAFWKYPKVPLTIRPFPHSCVSTFCREMDESFPPLPPGCAVRFVGPRARPASGPALPSGGLRPPPHTGGWVDGTFAERVVADGRLPQRAAVPQRLAGGRGYPLAATARPAASYIRARRALAIVLASAVHILKLERYRED